MANPTTERAGARLEKFATPFTRVWGYVVMAFALLVIAFWVATDIGGPLVAPLVALAFGLVTWVVLVRPEAVAYEHGLLLRNMIRDTLLPWAAINNCRVSQTLQLAAGDQVFHGLGVSKPARVAVKEQRSGAGGSGGRFGGGDQSAAPDPASMSQYGYVEERILRLATDARDKGEDPDAQVYKAWAPLPIVALLVSAAAVVLAVLIG